MAQRLSGRQKDAGSTPVVSTNYYEGNQFQIVVGYNLSRLNILVPGMNHRGQSRGVAQLASVLALGARGREFESHHLD